jgi:Protein of unknown function (DUF3467)
MEKPSRGDPSTSVPEGRYANYMNVGHNAFEVVLDFGQFYEGSTESRMHTRIVTSPVYAKHFLHLLQSSLAQYEQAFGVIPRGGPRE